MPVKPKRKPVTVIAAQVPVRPPAGLGIYAAAAIPRMPPKLGCDCAQAPSDPRAPAA